MLKFTIFLLYLTNFSIGSPVKPDQLTLLHVPDCSEELIKKVLPQELVKTQCNFTLKIDAELKAVEKFCLALHFQVLKFCHNGGKVGNANEAKEGEDVCKYITNQNRPPTCSEPDQFCQLNQKNKEELPQSCVEVCSQPGQSEICSSLVRATQYNTKLMGQNGHGILDLESFKKHKSEQLEQQESKVNEGDMLQAPEVPEEVAKKPDDLKESVVVENQDTSKIDDTFNEPPPPVIQTQNQLNELPKNEDTKIEDPIINEPVDPKEDPKSSLEDEESESVQVYPQIQNHMNDEEAIETQSTFFSYFVAFTILCIVGYLVFHNKKKIIALVLEGRRRNPSSRSSGTRRSSSAQYRKLDNLEEAMADTSDDNLRNVIY